MYDKKSLFLVFFVILLIFAGVFLLNKNQTLNKYLHDLQSQQNQINPGGVYNFSAQQIPKLDFPTVAYASDLEKNTVVYNPKGQKITNNINVAANGSGSSVTVQKPQQFMPGKYSLIVNQNGKKIEQDFTWGVLAINPNKSIYTTGETAILALAVLDEHGKMVCDAQVTLNIKDPTGKISTASVKDKTIIVNPECLQKSYTVNPDYETKFRVDPPGTYEMDLTAVTKNGTYSISDSFYVQEAYFDIERATATRIFPYSAYPVLVKIIAKRDFSGQIKEIVPASFTISPLENTTGYNDIQKTDSTQYILWNVSLKKGESINIGYYFKAPLISPQFYLLGPLSLVSGDTTVFEEKRAWQLAIDAVAYSSTILATSGLVSYWRLGESAGTNANDEQGTNDGTYTAGYTLSQPGAIVNDPDTAVLLNGTTGYVLVPDAGSLDIGNAPFSVELWFRRTGNFGAVDSELFSKFQQFALKFENSPSPDKLHLDQDGSVSVKSTTAFTSDNGWHHVVAVHDAGATKQNKIYIDGIEEGVTGTNNTFTAGTTELDFGRYYAGGEFFKGYLDEFAIYNVALSAAQVKAHYQIGQETVLSYSSTILNDNAIAYWRLGEASGNPQDSVGTSHVTTIGGTPTYGQTGAIINDSNKSILFNGTTNYFGVPDSATLDQGNGPLSWECWFKMNGNPGSGVNWMLMSKGAQAPYLKVLGSGTTSIVYFYIRAVDFLVHGSVDLQNSTTWHHVVATKSGNTTKLYLDGQDVTVVDAATATAVSNASEFDIGRDPSSPSDVFQGWIDEVAIYNYVLTPTQVLNHYNAGINSGVEENFKFQGLKLNGIKIN